MKRVTSRSVSWRIELLYNRNKINFLQPWRPTKEAELIRARDDAFAQVKLHALITCGLQRKKHKKQLMTSETYVCRMNILDKHSESNEKFENGENDANLQGVEESSSLEEKLRAQHQEEWNHRPADWQVSPFCVLIQQFEEFNMDLFRKTLKPVEQVLKFQLDVNVKKEDIHENVLDGGSTHIPKVQHSTTP
ncbi:hypothetical protein JOM56_002996 [Amanita muscaria]